MINNLTSQELEKTVRHVAKTYQKSVLRTNVCQQIQNNKEQNRIYMQDVKLINIIDFCLGACSRDTRCIIENEFLKKTDSYWYLEYYTKSTFYRLKKKAVKEFIDCMDL